MVQNFIVHQVASKLSKNIHATVSIKKVDIEFFDKMKIEGILIKDLHKDTLLYAQALKVNITDWFFWKDNIVLKYIGLDDAVINLNRKDVNWNYQFLLDYFQSPSKKTDTSKNVIKLDLQTISLNNVRLNQIDQWMGEDIRIGVDKLKLYADGFDMKDKNIRIRSLVLEKPAFSQFDYRGLKPKDTTHHTKQIVLPKPNTLQWNTDDWKLYVKRIDIVDGNLAVEQFTKRPIYKNLFDDQHILFSNLDATFQNVAFLQDTIVADGRLSARNPSGFVIKKITTHFKFTPELMEFKNLDIVTNKSHITNYFSMSYKDFNNDMNNFITNVRLKGSFVNAIVHSDDIAYFAPELKNWKKTFKINGKVSGSIDDISGDHVSIINDVTSFSGNFRLRGLPDIDKTLFNIYANDLSTNFRDITIFIPPVKQITSPNLSALGNINYKGSFNGLLSDFDAKGLLSTQLGSIDADIKMKLPNKGIATYSGLVTANNFNLGAFIMERSLGNINFSGKLNGRGFDLNSLALNVDGTVKNIYFNNYTYQNITALGTFKNKSFEGNAIIKDPNLDLPSLDGSIDFSKKLPEIKVKATLENIDLKNLHLANDPITIKGMFDLDFSGTNIDNFLGNAKVYNASIFHNKQQLLFDSLVINSYLSDQKKHLSIKTNEADVAIAGNFRLAQLPDAFQLFLNRYYPSYIPKGRANLIPQDFTFDLKTRNIESYISLIDKHFKGFNNSTISGSLNSPLNQLSVTAAVPSFKYKNITFNNVTLNALGGQDSLDVVSTLGETSFNDSLKFPSTSIAIKAIKDFSDISIKTSANQALNEADLSLRLQSFSDGFNLLFNPSSFVINNKRWELEQGGTLSLNKNLFTASQVKFIQDKQQLIIATTPSVNGSNDIVVELKDINAGDIAPFLIKNPRIEGLLTGKINITDPFDKFSAHFDTHFDQFRLDNDSIGTIGAVGNYSSVSKLIKGNLISDNELYNLRSDVLVNLADSADDQLGITTMLNNSEIHLLEKYLAGLFTNVYGKANGLISISGSFKQPKVTGDVRLSKTSFIVDYTKAKYILADNSLIKFQGDVIDIPKIVLHDTLNHVASVTGKMDHKFFNDFYFEDLSFVTDHFSNGQPGKFLLLNTTSKDNKDFYGHLVGDAHLSLNGPQDDMTMYISGEPTDSSHIYLPTGDVAEKSKIDYIDFIKFGREMRQDYVFKKQSNIKVNMDIDANPFAKIDVILDDVTGDVIKAQGNGKMNISVGSRDPLIMRGRYDIQQGLYTFNFQTFFKTPFALQSGYIEWQGDPYLANMNIDAIYKARQVDLSGIATSNGFTNLKGDIDILFKLRGTLKDPKPDFEFQFAFDNPLKSDPIANEYIRTKFESDRNTLNKEVTALLLFNSIITDQQNLLSGNNTGNFVTRTLGQVVSNTLSSSLNNILKKVLKTDAVNLYTNINTADFNFQNSQKTVQNVGNFGLRTAFLKNRLLLNVGGNIDYNLQRLTNTNSNFLFTPDVSFEYYITPDGKFRVVGFNRVDAGLGDVTGITRRNRTGLLLSYHKDFNTFNELFGVADKPKIIANKKVTNN